MGKVRLLTWALCARGEMEIMTPSEGVVASSTLAEHANIASDLMDSGTGLRSRQRKFDSCRRRYFLHDPGN